MANKVSNKELSESGILFIINKDILHPLGLALTATTDDERNETLEVRDYRHDCIWFDKETKTAKTKDFERYLDEHSAQIATSKMYAEGEEADYNSSLSKKNK